MNTRIAFVLSNLDEDGGQTVVCTLLKNLSKDKYTVKLFVLSSVVENKLTKELAENNIYVDFLWKKATLESIRGISLLLELNKAVKEFQPDVVHVHLDILHSWIWALWKKKRIIFTMHSEADRIRNKYPKWLYRRLQSKNLIRVIGVSNSASERFQTEFGADKVETIYNPIELKHFEQAVSKDNKIVKFINVARFHPVKNHKLLIDAFEKLCASGSNSILELVGDGQEYEDIKKYVLEKKLGEKVKFLGQIEDVAPKLAGADVFVLSSVSEAFPVSVIEAMAVGLPIIATNVGGLPELVKENGILVESNNVEAMCSAMLDLEQNQEKRKQMGECSKTMAEKFDISKIVKQYEKVYDEEAGH